MFSLRSSHRFYLYDGHCDMRKSFDGLCGLIISGMRGQPTSGEVFVFLNRSRTHMKLLHWERGGFVLYYIQTDGYAAYDKYGKKKEIIHLACWSRGYRW